MSSEIVKQAQTACSELRLIGKPRKRTRRPTADELARLREHFKGRDRRAQIPMQTVMEFAIASGRRESEICRLEWRDNDQTTRTGLMRDAKHPTGKDGNHRRFKYTPEVTISFKAWASDSRSVCGGGMPPANRSTSFARLALPSARSLSRTSNQPPITIRLVFRIFALPGSASRFPARSTAATDSACRSISSSQSSIRVYSAPFPLRRTPSSVSISNSLRPIYLKWAATALAVWPPPEILTITSGVCRTVRAIRAICAGSNCRPFPGAPRP